MAIILSGCTNWLKTFPCGNELPAEGDIHPYPAAYLSGTSGSHAGPYRPKERGRQRSRDPKKRIKSPLPRGTYPYRNCTKSIALFSRDLLQTIAKRSLEMAISLGTIPLKSVIFSCNETGALCLYLRKWIHPEERQSVCT